MQLLIPDPTYDHPERSKEEFLIELRTELKGLSSEFNLIDADAGHGADWPVVLAILGGLFFLAKPINENINAWLALAKKLGGMVERVRKKWGAARLDERGCILLALNRLMETHKGPIRSLELMGTVQALFQVFPWKDPKRLDHHPDALYVIGFRVNDERIHILGVKSKGTVEFEKDFSINYMDF
jgi:hypothetical protein